MYNHFKHKIKKTSYKRLKSSETLILKIPSPPSRFALSLPKSTASSLSLRSLPLASVLNDEFIAHRLGLIPLTSERAMSMRFSHDGDACDGDGRCEFCSVEFHLRAKCINDQTLDVKSKDPEEQRYK